ncbi:hypothetical protein NDU88_001955 [Pleurodeles waltl]|uniref:Uncharacterized protein n=1 Tax=Pleurodeles waltl TaxID=8319 RepID=A0AAV7P5D0_PLEWA|nr:hypothetical protein NDU88_001955 [Pleurodeles waltl]
MRKITKFHYYYVYAPIWDSPGSPEWTKDALAIPLKKAGFLQWKHLCYNGKLRDFDNLNIEEGGGLSKFKYLQMKSLVGNVTEKVGSTNGLVDQMQLDISMKKEVARWYWLMMDIVDGSEEDGGARSGESEVESAGEGPSTAVKAGNPGRGTGPLGGNRLREDAGSSESEEEGVLGAGWGEGQLSGRVGAPGTPDLFGHGPLDFEEEDPGEQRAALSPWEEEKASPRAASRMASSGRRGRRRRAADASARLCGSVGDAPPDAAAWEEQRLGPVRQWRYEGEAAGCAQCKGSGVKGWRKRLDEEDRRSEVTLEEGELRTSGSESEWWDRQGRRVANPVR